MLLGLISDANYVSFTNRYQSEQTEGQGKIAVLDTKLEQQIDYQAAVEQLRVAISDYLNIDILTPLILNNLIEKFRSAMLEMLTARRCRRLPLCGGLREQFD